jgi:hypothetical protein
MALPVAIIVDPVKLRDYCLSPLHPRGRHKARVFRSRLGLAAGDAEVLRSALLRAVEDHPQNLRLAGNDEHGQRYILDFEMSTARGSGMIRSSWIVPIEQPVLRFVTCYLL